MKSLVTTIAFLSLATFGARADRVETVNLAPFQKVFEVPTDAKNFRVGTLLPKKKIDTERTTTYRDNCENYDDSPSSNVCERSTYKTEPGYVLDVDYDSESERDSESMSSAQEMEVFFRRSEFHEEKIAALPIPKWYGKGTKANLLAAGELVRLEIKDHTQIEQVVDEARSVYCERDIDMFNYDPRCEDRLAYKPAPVTHRYLTVTVK